MFQVITKAQYFAALDDPTTRGRMETTKRQAIDLKHIQDAWVLHELRDARSLRILEIGGGYLRALSTLADQNEIWNLDDFGNAGTATANRKIPKPSNWKLILGQLGSFTPELSDSYFDVVVSISVIEHIPNDIHPEFWRDHFRVMKPGSKAFHAIDLYIGDNPAAHVEKRLELLLDSIGEAGLRFSTPPDIQRPLLFRSHFASNPDYGMWVWNQISPLSKLISTRSTSQSVSLGVIVERPPLPSGPKYSLDIPGWMHEEDLKVIARLANTVPDDGLIVEVGSWMGQSTYAWAANTKATVRAIDLWEWMPKEYRGPAAEKVDLKGDPYQQFARNVVGLKNVVPMRRNSSGGDWSFPPADIVFIDAMHQNPWVAEDIAYWEPKVKNGGIICGDDYSPMFPAVQEEVNKLAARLGTSLEFPGKKFWIVRKP